MVEILPYLTLVVLTAIPGTKLLRRTGLSQAWLLVALIPAGMLILLWVVAYSDWPARVSATEAGGYPKRAPG